MTGVRRAAWRPAAIVLAVALATVLAAAIIANWKATSEQGYWAAGFYRLLLVGVWDRFDRWAPAAAGATVIAGVLGRAAQIGRRTLLVALATIAIVGGVRALAALDAWRAGHGPNLLLISIDTLRADHLGAYGHSLPTSPTLDGRLAAAGVEFEEVYSQSPKTTPSHLTMLTSLYPAVHGVELWDGTGPAPALNPAVHTLAEVLRNAGYATAGFTGGAYVDGGFGFRQGFDVYEECGGQELGHAKRWIQHHRRRKFFVFFHTYQVHDPYVPPLSLVDQFDGGYQGPLRETVRRLRGGEQPWQERHRVFWAAVDRTDPRDRRFLERLYDAGIRHMDGTTLSGLLDQLDALDLARDTLVVFTSDHGEAFGEHGPFMHDDLYTGTLHVPLVLRFPGRLPAGARVREPAGLIDVMPTVLDLLGVPAPAGLQGRSLVPAIHGTPDPTAPPLVSDYSNRRSRRVYQSLRRGGLSYIADGPVEQLFDLARDPGEHTDLAGDRPADLAALRADLARWREDCRPLAARLGARDSAATPSEATVRELRALGYVE